MAPCSDHLLLATKADCGAGGALWHNPAEGVLYFPDVFGGIRADPQRVLPREIELAPALGPLLS